MGGGEVERRQSKTIAKIHYPQTKCREHTVWKFHDFPITQILCEINFEDS